MTDSYNVDVNWVRKIILEKNEYPYYDFKKELHFNVKGNKEDETKNRAELIRDMISLGNQALLNQRKAYLILGAKDGNITGISKTYDDNDFQVFLDAYISPTLKFLYIQSPIDTKLIGIFVIFPEGTQIFTVKKDYKFQKKPTLLSKGETWNRRGTSKYNITEQQDLLKLQTQLTEIIYDKTTDSKLISEEFRQEFWSSYLTEMKFMYKDLDFLGLNYLQDEPSVPLQDIFMSLQFKIESDVLRNPVIKNRIRKFIDALNVNENDFFNIPLEEDISQEQLIQLFDKIQKIENTDYHKVMYIEFLFLFKQLLIIGGPGFGKTTFLKFIWLEAEQKALFSKFDINDKPIPLFISLLEFESYLSGNTTQISASKSLIDFLVLKIKPKMLAEPISTNIRQEIIKDQLKNGNVILLFDGVDEVSDLQFRTQILRDIELFSNIYFNSMIIITSRPLAQLDQLKKIGFFPLSVQPLQLYEIRQFIKNWYSSKTHDTDTIRKQVNHLTQILLTQSGLLNLASNPLMLTLMVIIHRIEGTIPERRSILYQKTTNTFLETWDKKKGIESQFSLDSIKKSLNVLAFEIHSRFTKGSGSEISLAEAKRILIHHMRQSERLELLDAEEKVNAILNMFQARSGVLILKHENIIFWHSIFKDFFAAQYIKNTYIADLDRMWQLISELILDEKWLPIIKLFFGLMSELSLDIVFDYTEKILQSDSIPIFHQFQVLNDVLLENPDTTSYLLPKVFNLGLNALNTPDPPKNLHTKILNYLHPIIQLFSSEMITELVDYILRDFIKLTTRQDKDQFLGIFSRIFDSIYRKESDLLFVILKEKIPTDVLSSEIQSKIESFTNENLQLLRIMLEFPVLDNEEVFLDYYKFIRYSISGVSEIESTQIAPNCLKCYKTLLDSIQKCKKIFHPSIFLYFHYLLKMKKVHSSIEPFGFFREWNIEKDYNPFVNDLWMVLNIDNKFRTFLNRFQEEEGITKIVTQLPSRKKYYFYTTKKISLEPFKPVEIRLDANPAQKMMDQSEFCFRFRIQMKNHLWFITKKIVFSNINSLKEYEKQLEILEQQIKPFGIIIIKEEEYTIVNQGFEHLRKNQIEKILELAQKALNLDELFYPALYLKSEALGRLYRFEESDQINAIMFEEFPNDSWVFYRQALNYSRSFRFEEILNIQKSETINNLSDAFFLLYKAEAYSQLGEYSKAGSLFLKIESKLSKNIEYQITYTEHLIRKKEIQKTIQLLSQVNQEDFKINKLYYVRKMIILNLETKNSAAVTRWIKIGKEIGIKRKERIYYQIFLFKEKGKIHKALKLAKRSIKKYPEDLDLLNLTGIIYLTLKKFHKARELFQTTIELNEKYSNGWYNIACTCALEGNVEEALNALSKAINLEPYIRIGASNEDDFQSIKHLKGFQELILKKDKDH